MLSQFVQEAGSTSGYSLSGPALSDFPQQGAWFASEGAQPATTMEEVRKFYDLLDYFAISSFLKRHRALPELLLAALPQLKRHFGLETVFRLTISVDESGSQTLYATARWLGAISDVMAAMENFDNAWWIAHSREADGYLNFTYELA